MAVKNTSSSPKNKTKHRVIKWIVITLGVLLVLWAAYAGIIAWVTWVYVLRGPEYQAAEARCGHKPVITTTDMTGSGRYYLLPTDSTYHGPLGGLSFCTENEAVSRGFRHEPYAEAMSVIRRCGGAPVVVGRHFSSKSGNYSYAYQLPQNANSHIVSDETNIYYCTEQQAIDAGYSKDLAEPAYN